MGMSVTVALAPERAALASGRAVVMTSFAVLLAPLTVGTLADATSLKAALGVVPVAARCSRRPGSRSSAERGLEHAARSEPQMRCPERSLSRHAALGQPGRASRLRCERQACSV